MSNTTNKKDRNPAMLSFSLPKPFTYENATYQDFSFDFSTLTGNDSAAVERIMKTRNVLITVPEWETDYHILLAVRASKTPVTESVLRALPIRYFNKIRVAVRSFLLSLDWDEEEETTSENDVLSLPEAIEPVR